MTWPEQKTGLLAFWRAAFNANPDGIVFAPTAVYWGPTNMPVPGWPWAKLEIVGQSDLGYANPKPIVEAATKKRLLRVMKETTIEVQVGHRTGDTPSHAADAVHILDQAKDLIYDDDLIYDELTKLGMGLMRVDDVIPLPGLVNDSQWETRASLTFTVSRAATYRTTNVSTIESVGLSVSVSPIPGTVTEDVGP